MTATLPRSVRPRGSHTFKQHCICYRLIFAVCIAKLLLFNCVLYKATGSLNFLWDPPDSPDVSAALNKPSALPEAAQTS